MHLKKSLIENREQYFNPSFSQLYRDAITVLKYEREINWL